MKTVWVILIFMLMFNIMIMFTSGLNIFEYSVTGEMSTTEVGTYTGYTNSTGGLMALIGLELTIGATTLAALAGGVVAAITHSIVPLLLGAFVGFFASLFGSVYSIFSSTEFGINTYLLLAGTAGMGILLIVTLFEMGTGGHNA